MIGKRIRGFRHLIRLAKSLDEVRLLYKHDIFQISYAVAVYESAEKCKNPYMSSNADYLIIFNTQYSNVKFSESYHDGSEHSAKIKELAREFPSVWVVPVSGKANYSEESSLFSQMIALPEDFEKKYADFREANKKQMPNAERYAGVECPLYKYLFVISNGSKNFFFWAVNAHFKQQVSIFLIEKILLWNENYNQLSNKLKKGTITAYTGSRDFFDVVREMAKLRRDKRASDVINMFNTAQKKALKSITLNNRDYDTLSKFGKLSMKKKLNFIKKMSTVEDASEILKQMSFLADVHFEWKKESLMEFLKNTDNFNCEVVIDRDNIVLLKVKDYETVKRLAKTTNWCISKDKKYWNEYVEHNPTATQYVLMDFSRKEDDNLSIVGFTSVHDRGITNAHDFQNRNLMQGRRTNAVSEIKSFISRFVDCSSIWGVLDRNGIKLSDVVSYEPNQYKWSRENMFEYLHQCISDDDYYIIHDDGNRVALIADNDNVRYFLGDAYMEQRGPGHDTMYGNQHIIFADFTKKQNDPEKLIFGVINHNFAENESSCSRLYNDRFEALGQSFDSKLEEYGLPYDIICRTDNPIERFYNSLSAGELATLRDLLKNNKKLVETLKKRERSGFIRDSIINITFNYNSADYINLFYDNGVLISDIIGGRNLGEITRRMVNNMFDIARNGRDRTASVPTEKEIDEFKKGLTTDYNSAMYIGSFLMLMKIMDNETNTDFYLRLAGCVHERHMVCDLFDLILTRICRCIDLNNSYDTAKYIASYAFNLGSPRVVNVLNSLKLKDSITDFIHGCQRRDYQTTEMWVRNQDGAYVVEGVNEEVAAHAPRRR